MYNSPGPRADVKIRKKANRVKMQRLCGLEKRPTIPAAARACLTIHSTGEAIP